MTGKVLQGPDGISAIYYDDRVYYGCIKDGEPHGKGLQVFTDGRSEAGSFERGCLHGTGVRIETNDNWEIGEFSESQINSGISVRNEQVHIGQFSAGQLSSGCDVQKDMMQIGKFTDGELDDFGIQNSKKENNMVIGNFQHSQLNGLALKIRAFCSEIGTYKSDELYGQGIRKTDKDLYEGGFLAGKYNGLGQLLTQNEEFSGFFKRGEKFGIGCLKRRGITVQGQFNFGPQNKGVITFPDGGIYKGEFRGGVPEGEGIIEYFNQKFAGSITDGCRHGMGTETYAGGISIEGIWNKDILEGSCTVICGGIRARGEAHDGKILGVEGDVLTKVMGSEYKMQAF